MKNANVQVAKSEVILHVSHTISVQGATSHIAVYRSLR
jgi:hypothetical protein